MDAAFQKNLVFIHLNFFVGKTLASEFGPFSTSPVNSLTYIILNFIVSFFKDDINKLLVLWGG